MQLAGTISVVCIQLCQQRKCLMMMFGSDAARQVSPMRDNKVTFTLTLTDDLWAVLFYSHKSTCPKPYLICVLNSR